MADPAMLAAVSAAVRGEDPPVVVTPPDGEPPAGDPPVTPPAGAADDLIGLPPSDPPVGDPPVTPPVQPQADADGRIRGPDGKFAAAAPKPGDPPVTPPVAGAPAAAVPPVPPKPPADPINDPIPPNAKPETRERIQTLVDRVKTTDTELGQVRGDFDALMAPIKDANVTFEQFTESMNVLKLVNSPHQHEQMQALQYFQGVTAALAERLGQVLPGTDPLTGHADLIQAVQTNKMPREYAEEVAKSRRFTQATQQHQRQTQQQSEQQRAQQGQIQAGQAAVREVELTLEATDPQFAAKIALMRADASFVNALRSVHPSQWATKFSAQYRTIKVPAAAPIPQVPNNNSPSPLRLKTPAGNNAKPPTTMLDAVRGGLADLRAG
jgi:hypothetical protein